MKGGVRPIRRKVGGAPGGHQVHRDRQKGGSRQGIEWGPELRCPKARARAPLPTSSFPPNALPPATLAHGGRAVNTFLPPIGDANSPITEETALPASPPPKRRRRPWAP